MTAVEQRRPPRGQKASITLQVQTHVKVQIIGFVYYDSDRLKQKSSYIKLKSICWPPHNQMSVINPPSRTESIKPKSLAFVSRQVSVP